LGAGEILKFDLVLQEHVEQPLAVLLRRVGIVVEHVVEHGLGVHVGALGQVAAKPLDIVDDVDRSIGDPLLGQRDQASDKVLLEKLDAIFEQHHAHIVHLDQ
jgi:hypothetical protein